ncbi:MAG: MFS transporter [Lentisphaeria bacterium]
MNDNTVNWKRNLVVMWITQFLSICGFSLALPFAPFYFRECLGVVSESDIRMYAALSAAAANLSFAVMSPIWGSLADRFGRKTMVLRATFGGAFVLAAIGFIHTIQSYFVLRLLQGVFTGTMSASLTLVVSCAPKERSGFALGVLSSSVFSGQMMGLFLGGLLATHFGYRAAFKIAGLVLFISAFLVLFGAQEHFKRPAIMSHPLVREFNIHEIWRKLRPAIGLLLICAFANTARLLDYSQFPLYVEMLNGGSSVSGAARWTSLVMCMGSIGAMLSGFVLGRLVDRHSAKVAYYSAAGAAIFMLGIAVIPWALRGLPPCVIGGSPSFVWPVVVLMPLRFCFIFCSAGLEPVWNMWLSRQTANKDKGAMFGWAGTFRSIGGIGAHLLAGLLVYFGGIRTLFFVAPFLLLSLIPLVKSLQKGINARIKALDMVSGDE